MPQEYRPANAAKGIAMELMAQVDAHGHLVDQRVEFIFLAESAKSKGAEQWGRAKVMSGLNAWLASKEQPESALKPTSFFVIEISETVWNILNDRQRRALVDHLLSQCRTNEGEDSTGLRIAYPDVVEFSGVIERHGLYRDELEKFVNIALEGRQQGLFDGEGANESARLPRPTRAKRGSAAAD